MSGLDLASWWEGAVEPVALIEQLGDEASTNRVVRLTPGDSATIGSCRCGDCSLDLVLDAHIGHVMMTVNVHDDHWKVYNIGFAPLILENDAQLCEYLTVQPDGRGRPVPYDTTRIRDAHTNDPIAIVTATFHETSPELPKPCPNTGEALLMNHLARDTKHFAVLTALCRPRLTYGPGAPLPSSSEIATLIRSNGPPVTPRAVDSQIDYLLEKLDVLRSGDTSPGGGRGWKRELLATEAVRRGIVTQADLRS